MYTMCLSMNELIKAHILFCAITSQLNQSHYIALQSAIVICQMSFFLAILRSTRVKELAVIIEHNKSPFFDLIVGVYVH